MVAKISTATLSIVPIEQIANKIYFIRGQKVILDADLADLYEVPTYRLNEAIKRNLNRFPEDFMFQLAPGEAESLTSQIAMSKGRGGRRTLPYVFTEHGVVMLSSVLNSDRAVQMNILIVRAFIRLRELLATHKDLARKMEDLERKQTAHGQQLETVISVVKQLIDSPPKPKRRMGFSHPDEPDETET